MEAMGRACRGEVAAVDGGDPHEERPAPRIEQVVGEARAVVDEVLARRARALEQVEPTRLCSVGDEREPLLAADLPVEVANPSPNPDPNPTQASSGSTRAYATAGAPSPTVG